jgi:thiol:disulfide interchange protein
MERNGEMLRRVTLGGMVTAALLLAGCADRAPSSPGSALPAATSVASSAAASPSAAVTEAIPDHYDPARDPATDLKAALALAAKDRKEVLVDFGADWCPDCRVLDTLFQSTQTKPLLQRNYHVVAVDVGQFDHNLDFAAGYVNLKTSGIPALVILAPNGKVRVATNDGSFADARTMNSDQVNAFLTRWAPQS